MTNKKALSEKSKQELMRRLRHSAVGARSEIKEMLLKAQEFQKDIKKLN